MKDTKEKTRLKNRNPKKRKMILVFLSIPIVTVIGMVAYFYSEYKQGLTHSEKTTDLQNRNIEFNGVKDEFGKVNVLLLGIDARENEQSRTDTIMIAQYDPDAKKSKIVSVMRDCYVDIPGYGKHKINAAYAKGGPELLRKTIKKNFGLDIQYYALVDFKGFVKMIDAAFPKGIPINVEKEMSEGIDLTLTPGKQNLHGKELLGYVRFRKDAESDFGRVQRQQEVLTVIANEVTSAKGAIKIPRMIGTMQPYMKTNMEKSDVLSIVSSVFSADARNIETLRIPVDDSFTDQRINNQDVLVIDVEKNKQALKEFLFMDGAERK